MSRVCATHNIPPHNTHWPARHGCGCLNMLSLCASAQSRYFQDETADIRKVTWISPFCHMYMPAVLLVLLLYHNYKGMGKKLLLFFYPNLATVCCRRTRDFCLTVLYILSLANILHLNLLYCKIVTWICTNWGKNITVISVCCNKYFLFQQL